MFCVTIDNLHELHLIRLKSKFSHSIITHNFCSEFRLMILVCCVYLKPPNYYENFYPDKHFDMYSIPNLSFKTNL